MHRVGLLLILLAVLLSTATACQKPGRRPSVRAVVEKSNILQQLERVDNFLKTSKRIAQKHNLNDLSLECAVCGIAVNEIEGLLRLNLTLQQLEQLLDAQVCSFFSGDINAACKDLMNRLPWIISKLEAQWGVSTVCMALGMCAKPFKPHVDPSPIPTHVINLDLSPQLRWAEICSIPEYQQAIQFLVDTVDNMLPGHGRNIETIGELINNFYYPEDLALEIRGCAMALGIGYGWATLYNLGYEATNDCTSMVVQTIDGTILHARNLDFGAGMGFTDTLRNITFIADYQRGGKTLFKTTTFVGYVGAVSGIKPHAFSLTVNSRFFDNGNLSGIPMIFQQLIWALEEKNASLVTFLTRQVLENENDYDSAFYYLNKAELITLVYYILAGTKPGQGAVITRNPQNSTHLWTLQAPQDWYVVQTNYDWWTQPPWYDNRVTPAENALKAMGQAGVTLDGLFKVLSTKPVMNAETAYSLLSVPANNTWMSWARWCPFPCVQ